MSINMGGVLFEVVAEAIKAEDHSKTQPTRIGINLTGPQARGHEVITSLPAAAAFQTFSRRTSHPCRRCRARSWLWWVGHAG